VRLKDKPLRDVYRTAAAGGYVEGYEVAYHDATGKHAPDDLMDRVADQAAAGAERAAHRLFGKDADAAGDGWTGKAAVAALALVAGALGWRWYQARRGAAAQSTGQEPNP
jgi:hypothetical protein